MLVEKFVTVASCVRLFTAISDGPQDRALLVIHGGPDWDHTYLRDPLINLAGRHRLILPDLRGCGRSTVGLPDADYTPDAAVSDLVALLDALGLSRVDVLGFSYGGLLAQRLAVFTPMRVRRLIIASSSVEPVPDDAFADWPERNERMRTANAAWSDTNHSGPALTRAAALAAVAVNVWTDAAAINYLERLDQIHFTAEWLRPFLAGQLPLARPDQPTAQLTRLGLPTLLLHGEHDMVFPSALAFRAQAEIPTASAAVLTAAGHMAHIDQPAAWLAAVSGFLEPQVP